MAEALRCAQCGASLPSVAPELASVLCASCGHVNRLEGALLEGIHGHRRAVAGARQEAEHAGEFAAIAQTTRSFGAGWAWLFVGSWLLAGFVAMPETALAKTLALAIVVGPFVAMIFISSRRHRSARAAVDAEREERAVFLYCPSCGGQSELAPDAAVAACAYCKGAMAASPQEQAELLAAALASRDSEAHKARVEHWRLAAHNNQRIMPIDLAPFVTIGLISATFVAATVSLDIYQLVAFTPDRPQGTELVVLNLIAFVLLGVSVGPPWWRRHRAQGQRAMLAAFAARSEAEFSTQLTAHADYLAAHWSDDFPAQWIAAGRGYGFVTARGAPWWGLSCAPHSSEEHIEVHLRLIVPGDAQGDFLQGFVSGLSALGMNCELREGGLVASATGKEAVLACLADGALDAIAGVLRAKSP